MSVYSLYIVMKKKDALGASVIAPIARTKYFEFSFYFHLKHKIIYVYSRIFTYIIALLVPTCRGLLSKTVGTGHPKGKSYGIGANAFPAAAKFGERLL